MKLTPILFWIFICAMVGFVVNYFSDISFWVGAGIAFLGLLVNATVIAWEDRQPGGWNEE